VSIRTAPRTVLRGGGARWGACRLAAEQEIARLAGVVDAMTAQLVEAQMNREKEEKSERARSDDDEAGRRAVVVEPLLVGSERAQKEEDDDEEEEDAQSDAGSSGTMVELSPAQGQLELAETEAEAGDDVGEDEDEDDAKSGVEHLLWPGTRKAGHRRWASSAGALETSVPLRNPGHERSPSRVQSLALNAAREAEGAAEAAEARTMALEGERAALEEELGELKEAYRAHVETAEEVWQQRAAEAALDATDGLQDELGAALRELDATRKQLWRLQRVSRAKSGLSMSKASFRSGDAETVTEGAEGEEEEGEDREEGEEGEEEEAVLEVGAILLDDGSRVQWEELVAQQQHDLERMQSAMEGLEVALGEAHDATEAAKQATATKHEEVRASTACCPGTSQQTHVAGSAVEFERAPQPMRSERSERVCRWRRCGRRSTKRGRPRRR
jgi:hypothetical protein